MEKAAQALSELRKASDRLYICLTGGRKEMVASMTLLARLSDVEAVYHVVSPEIKVVSAVLERIRKDIEELANSENPNEYYRQKRDVFNPVMYTPSTSYNIIYVSIVPYPQETPHKHQNPPRKQHRPKKKCKAGNMVLAAPQRKGPHKHDGRQNHSHRQRTKIIRRTSQIFIGLYTH
ncbi:MAG: CRISPR-associated ring nuclease [Candidatus Caldarchaeum sp.]